MPICPVCGRDLKNPDSPGHINSKYHQEALKKEEIEEPAEKEEVKPAPKEEKTKTAPSKPKKPPKLDKTKPVPKLNKLELKPLNIETKTTKPEPITDENSNQFTSEEYMDLEIPMIPEPPKKKQKLEIDVDGHSSELMERMQDMESEDTKVVLVLCERCGEVIPVPIPKEMVLNDELPVVPVTYVHYNNDNKDQHCITLYLDHDFDMRRKRYSSVVIGSKYLY